jgi:hypothetical protein
MGRVRNRLDTQKPTQTFPTPKIPPFRRSDECWLTRDFCIQVTSVHQTRLSTTDNKDLYF